MPKKKNIKKTRYKRKIRMGRVFGLTVLLLIVALCVCLFTPVFGVSEITVEGNTVVAAEEAVAVSGIKQGNNIFRVNAKKAEQKLEELAYVENAEIVRKFPAKIKIILTESTNDIIIDTPTEFIVATVGGKVLFKTLDVTELPIPIVKGINVASAEPAQLIVPADEEKSSQNMEYVKCFFGSEYWSEIDEFDVSDPANFMMIMRSGMRVTFGQIETKESLERKIKMLDAIVPQVKVSERSYLDLTTDKGYFGTYSHEEYEEIKKLRQDGELIKKLTEEPPAEETESDATTEATASGEASSETTASTEKTQTAETSEATEKTEEKTENVSEENTNKTEAE